MSQNKLPYSNEAVNHIYEMLFADNIDLYIKNNNAKDQYPWKELSSERYDENELIKITEDVNADSRTRLLAYNKLSSNGYKSAKKELLGVIIEVGLENGLDVLAAYRDGTARYINFSEKLVIWESPVRESDELISKIFSEGEKIVAMIGPWDKPRLEFPDVGNVRISLLVSDGLYFGQGEMQTFFNEPMSKPILSAGLALMQFLMQQTETK